jgi:hypothetical protein
MCKRNRRDFAHRRRRPCRPTAGCAEDSQEAQKSAALETIERGGESLSCASRKVTN